VHAGFVKRIENPLRRIDTPCPKYPVKLAVRSADKAVQGDGLTLPPKNESLAEQVNSSKEKKR
jgi:hypothetical protein